VVAAVRMEIGNSDFLLKSEKDWRKGFCWLDIRDIVIWFGWRSCPDGGLLPSIGIVFVESMVVGEGDGF